MILWIIGRSENFEYTHAFTLFLSGYERPGTIPKSLFQAGGLGHVATTQRPLPCSRRPVASQTSGYLYFGGFLGFERQTC